MNEFGIIKIVLIFVIVVGILTTFWAFTSAVNESIEHARNLDFDKWSESLVSILLIGITLIIAGAIGELILFFTGRQQREDIW